jgi:F-type H+-transporting ATPase subunit delta
MSVTRIATRYAKSLLDLSIEQGKLEPVYADIQELQSAIRNRQLYLLMKSPVIHADKKLSVLDALFANRLEPLTMAYLRLLVQKGREMYVPEITAEFAHQYKALKGITPVRVTSAAPLSEAVLEELRRRIIASGAATSQLELETKIDPELIGGFVLEFDNKRYDASIAHKLDELRGQFSKNLYIKEI